MATTAHYLGSHGERVALIARNIMSRLSSLRSNERGAVAVLAAILFPVVIGGMGLGAETGYWYMLERKLQHAADTSAHAAAVRKRAGDGKAAIDAAALHIAVESGFSISTGTITVYTPPVAGPNAGDPDSVEVLLSETQPLLFSSVFRDEPVTIRTRAVVKIVGGAHACVLALSTTAPAALQVAGSTVVTLNGCSVASNSNASDALKMQGDGRLTADCAYTVGEAVVTPNLVLNSCPAVKPFAPVTLDPYASLEEPALTAPCHSGSVGDTTLVPTEPHPSGTKVMRFCDGLAIRGTVNFEPGLYIIESKDLSVNAGAVLKGSGVTFYFAKGAGLKLNGGATSNLSAPVSGPFSGVLFFGERNSTVVVNQVNGATGSTFNGTIYFPGSGVEYSGRAGATGGCTQIIGRTVTFIGNSEVKSDCQAAGARNVVTNQSIIFSE